MFCHRQRNPELPNCPKMLKRPFIVAFNWKRCAFRTSVVFFLLFIAECLPNFGSLLDLIGGSTVTLLTFVFPPFFYMRLVDSSQENKEWKNR